MKKRYFFVLLLATYLPMAAQNTVHHDVAENDSTCEDDELHVKLSEVVVNGVTGQSLLRESPLPFLVVSNKELTRSSSTNVIDAIARMPGMSQLTTGSGISKPVIRGLGYNRVAVVNDGIRQEGQQWGDEHGIEVDAASVNSVEILKGPASLMYGSDAMAGVIVFRSQPTLPMGTMKADVQSEYQTNNGLYGYSLNFGGNKQGVVWNMRYSEKAAHAYKNKYDGWVPGSQFHERAASALAGLNKQWGFSHLILGYYHLTPSIIEGERDAEKGELELPDGWKPKGYDKSTPFQQIHHYKAVVDNSFYVGDGGRLNAVFGYQQNRRQEFEEPDEAELDFMLHTANYDVRYISPDFGRGWKISTGINGMWQRSLNKGEEALIPAYKLFDFGIFTTATKTWARWNLSGGLRFDRRHLHSEEAEDEEHEGEMRFHDFQKNLNGVSGSIGATYCVNNNLHLRLNASRGFRAPNLSELGSNGIHEGSLRYEIGNDGLKPEFSWQMDFGIDYSSHIVSAQLSLFANHIDNFIFLERLASSQENSLFSPLSSLSSKYDIFRYTSGTAQLWGGEASVVVHPFKRLHIENTFSYVATRLLHQDADSRYLPYTPQPRWTASVRYDLQPHSTLHTSHSTFANAYVSMGWECHLKQNHVHTANETETATPSYTLLNSSAGTDVQHHGKTLFTVYLTANNLLNRAYQNHLSRLKYADVNNVTGRRGVFNMGRNFGVKVVVPIEL